MISIGVHIGVVLSTGLIARAGFHCVISLALTLARARKKLPEGVQERETNAQPPKKADLFQRGRPFA